MVHSADPLLFFTREGAILNTAENAWRAFDGKGEHISETFTEYMLWFMRGAKAPEALVLGLYA